MALEVKTERIGDYTYRVTQLGARESGRVFFRLCNIFAPIFDGLDIKGSKDLEAAALGGISRALKTIKAEDFEFLVTAFGKSTEVETSPEVWPRIDKVYEEHFAGRFGDQFRWVAFCINVNYASFLGDIKAKLEEKSPSPTLPESS